MKITEVGSQVRDTGFIGSFLEREEWRGTLGGAE